MSVFVFLSLKSTRLRKVEIECKKVISFEDNNNIFKIDQVRHIAVSIFFAAANLFKFFHFIREIY